METFLDFFLFKDPTARYVVAGIILISLNASLVGCFAFLRKRALIGDAVAHAVLPGICLAFLIFQSRDLLILLSGATITGWIALVSIDLLTRYSRIKSDAAIGIVLSVFFAAGIMLLTMIQQKGIASQSGLDQFLFGKAATISKDDVKYFLAITVIILVVIVLFYKPFRLISFDNEFAVSMGLPVRVYEIILSIITVMAIAAGIQAVGVVLIAALLITPAAAARYWTNNLFVMMVLSVLISAVSGIGGAYVSYTTLNMPTGPWIIIFISVVAFLSFAFSPKKGMVTRAWLLYKNSKKILHENILKAFYHLSEKDGHFFSPRSIEEIKQMRSFNNYQLINGLRYLKRKDLLKQQDGKWLLSEKGLENAKRMIRLHRLWELYLTNYLKIAEDHVHEDAEAIEHVITPEIEERLEKLLDYPSIDPHGKEIKY